MEWNGFHVPQLLIFVRWRYLTLPCERGFECPEIKCRMETYFPFDMSFYCLNLKNTHTHTHNFKSTKWPLYWRNWSHSTLTIFFTSLLKHLHVHKLSHLPSDTQELRVASEFLVASQFCVYSCTSQTLPSINCLMS